MVSDRTFYKKGTLVQYNYYFTKFQKNGKILRGNCGRRNNYCSPIKVAVYLPTPIFYQNVCSSVICIIHFIYVKSLEKNCL